MEGRFKRIQGPTPAPRAAPAPIARVAAESSSAARPGSPAASRLARPQARAASPARPVYASPEKPSYAAPPQSSLPTPSRVRAPSSSTNRFGAPAHSRLPSGPTQPLQQHYQTTEPSRTSSAIPSDPFGTRSAASSSIPFQQPSARSIPQSTSSRSSSSHDFSSDPSLPEIIRSILSSDPNRAVDGLKACQQLLDGSADRFVGHVDAFVRAVVKQMQLAFPNLDRPEHSRLAKHLLHTLEMFSVHKYLLEEMSRAATKELLNELTYRLLETEGATGRTFQITSPRSVLSTYLTDLWITTQRTRTALDTSTGLRSASSTVAVVNLSTSSSSLYIGCFAF
jgi:hypothetical protein